MFVQPAVTIGGVPSLRRRTLKSTGAFTDSTIGTYSSVVASQSKSPVSSPGFVDGIRKAGSYSRTISVAKQIPQSWSWHQDATYTYEYWGGWGVTSPNLSTFASVSYPPYQYVLDRLKSRAETECRAKMNAGKVDIGVALGESRAMIGHIALQGRRVLGLLDMVRRRSRRRRESSDLSSLWLEYTYAWLPLLNDIYGTYQLLQDGLASKGQIVTARRTVSETFDLNTSESKVPIKLSVHVSLWARVENQRIAAMRNLGLINPALVAWNVMPWSFVIDWFLPIGTFLEAATATAGLDFVTGSYTRFASVNHAYTYEYKPVVQATPGRIRHELTSISMNRGVYGSFPIPKIYLNRNPFSGVRGVSGIALFLQQLKKVR